MAESLREILYPLGFLSGLMFGGRFLVQWLSSELKGKSIVPRSFWYLSLAGNVMLYLHAFIQLQFHVFIVQACNGVISWRNINLSQSPQKRFSFQSTCFIFVLSILFSAVLFYIYSGGEWFRIPKVGWINTPVSLGMLWHFFGFTGIILFASRFWVQWWCSEIRGVSYLGRPFWWLSLLGDLIMLIYFYTIGDPVNIVGPLFGLIPYVRNLILLRREAV